MTPSNPVKDTNEPITDASGKMLTEADLDADLKEQLASVKIPAVKKSALGFYLKTQKERNDQVIRRQDMTPIALRKDRAREQVANQDLERSDIHHIHSVLALCALPYRAPKKGQSLTEYTKEYGRMSLTVHAGKIADPYTGKMIEPGLPYGPKARLLMLHICTRALRQQSPVVDLEDTLSAFIRSMGIEPSTGSRGNMKVFKDQINRLASCSMQIGLFHGERATTINTHPISSIDLWLPRHPEQQMLWNSTVTLSRDFYESLSEHALPVDIRSLSVLSHSAKQMDILLWLAYRVRGLKKNYFLSWDILKEQFCQSGTHRMIDFQRDFKKDLHDIEAVFEKPLPLKLSDKGLLLMPCDPERLFVPPALAKPLFKGIRD